jgi:hypothetical protein
MIALGIDIGITGAVSAVDQKGGSQVFDLPTLPDGERRRLDGRGLILLMRQLVPAGETVIAVIEDVRPRPNPTRGTSIVTEGNLMRSRGIVEAALDIARIEIKVVQPQAWKRFYGLIGSKKKTDSLPVARALYPAAPLGLQKHHNRADAVLIAHFGLARFA